MSHQVPPFAPRPAEGLPGEPHPDDARVPPGAADHLVVFARVPQLGQVKTRLAAGLGEQAALSAYRELLHLALSAAAAVAGVARWLCWTGDDARGECAQLARQYGFALMRQTEGDLGRRMAYALRHCLASGARRAVLMGCDCPPIDAAMLRRALDALAAHDTVWGPTEDGGYALVGVRQDCEAVFESIDWSTDRVMRQTRERLCAAGLTGFELPLLWDVDDAADWQRWQAWRKHHKEAR